MNDKELQNLIRDAVRQVLQEKGITVATGQPAAPPAASLSPPSSVLSPAPAGRVLVAVCCDECLSDAARSGLEALKTAGFVVTEPGEHELKKRVVRERLIGKNDVVLLPSVGDDDAAKMALGIFDEPVARVALSALALGKPLLAVLHAPYAAALKKRSPLLSRLFDGYRQILHNYGFEIVAPEAITAAVQAHCVPQLAPAPAALKAAGGKKALVTAADIDVAARNGKRLQLPPGALVTPLARDRARELGVQLD